jgi:hypothetical protein
MLQTRVILGRRTLLIGMIRAAGVKKDGITLEMVTTLLRTALGRV